MKFTSRRKPLHRLWMLRLLAAGFAVLIACLLSEIFLRLFVPDTRSPYIYDEFTGTRLKAGHRFVHMSEGYSKNVINSQGLRDREHSLQKPAGTFRIAVLGDSFSEAFQVSQDQAFWAVLERELQTKPEFRDRNVEVINFGVSGFGTVQAWQMLEHYARDYSPDLVLLAFLPGNDVRNNSPELEPDRRRPFANLEDQKLLLDLSFRDNPAEKRFREWTWSALKDQAIRRSRLVHLLYQARVGWRSRSAGHAKKTEHSTKDHQTEPLQVVGSAPLGVEEAGIDDEVFVPPIDALWTDAWEVTDRVLEAMQNVSRAMEAKFVVAVLNNSAEVHPDPEVTMSLARKLGVSDLDYPQQRLIASGERYGFPVICLLERMRDIARRDRVCFHGFSNAAPCGGHWNEQGHETAGKLIAEDLAGLLREQ